jgi:hypothetical protein
LKLDLKTAEAVVRLQNNPDFQLVLESMNAYRHELFEFVMYGPSEDAHTYRGMARGITEVQRGLGGAKSYLEKSRTRR